MAEGSGFLKELTRRHVWRVAIAYVVTAWVLLQLASVMLPSFGAPDWVMRVLFGLLLILFPIALILAWALEITPEGIRRTAPADSPDARETHDTRALGRKLNTGIIVALVIAVALLLANQFLWHRGMRDVAVTAPASEIVSKSLGDLASAIPAKSIAVLPFENLSSDKDNAYFASGMQDLILTKLADIGDLKVISRTSTMKYKSRPDNLKQVAVQLGVATILEGSVQKIGNQVLVNVQLINASTDSHLWAQSYTRTLDNVFSVEGEVATQIATALNTKLSPAQVEQLARAPSTNQVAMDLFLRAEYHAKKGDTNYLTTGDYADWRAAIPLYRQAIAKDPGFALAYARLSYVESHMAYITGEDVAALNRQARSDAEAAQKLAPHAVATLLALGYCEYYGNGDFEAALKTFDAALALRPNDSAALAAKGYVERKQNNYDDALATLQQAFALDPRNSALAYEIGSTYMSVSHFADAGNWYQRALAIDPHNASAKYQYPQAILFDRGDVARALAVAQGDDPAMQLLRVNLLTYQRKFAGALALLDAIPDTPDNFALVTGSPKALQQADLYRMMGEPAKAQPLYRQALDALRAQLAKPQQAQNRALGWIWISVADAELGVGDTKAALNAIASAQAANAKFNASMPVVHASATLAIASLYAQAHRPDLSMPLLSRALAMPAIGMSYSPALLWLDPAWDPIRHDPGFQALLKKYVPYKPAVTYATPPSASAASASTSQ